MGSRLIRVDDTLAKEILKVKRFYEAQGIDLSFPEASKLVYLDIIKRKRKGDDDGFTFSL